MATISGVVQVDEARAARSIEDACARLESADGELVLDLSSVERLDPSAVVALNALVPLAKEKATKLVLRGVNVNVYKVLKLVRLSNHFTFVS